jgi:hypothetical protein
MTESTRERPAGGADVLPTDALKDAGQQVLGLLVQRAAGAATERVSNLSDRLTAVSENGGEGLGTALLGRRDGDSGDGQARGNVLTRGLSALKDKAKEALGGGGGGRGKKLKVTNIVEDIDVGLPLRTTYDLWTQLADFPSYMKKVESVEQASDEKTNWKAQVWWSHRTWEATIVEQVPDSHIVWRSKGAKGHVDGAVTFTGLGPNLTRVLLVLEYHPQGLFERTGNLWRAQGRRARLEFKHFRRHAMSNVLMNQQKVEGWRGEIHDSEVTKTHEEALEEEQRALEEAERPEEAEPEREAEAAGGEPGEEGPYDEEEPAGEEEYAEEDREDLGEEDEYAEEGDERDEEEDEYDEEDEYADQYGADEYAEEEEAEQVGEEEPVPARSRRGR